MKETIKDMKKMIYKPPLPKKAQRTTPRGRSGKVKIYTEEEIFLYKMRQFRKLNPEGGDFP